MDVLLLVKTLLPGCRPNSYLGQAENLGPNTLQRVKREGDSWRWSDFWIAGAAGSFWSSCVLLKLVRGRNMQEKYLRSKYAMISFQKAVLPLYAYNQSRSDWCGFKPQRQRMLPVRAMGPRSWEGDDVVVVAWKLWIAWEMKKGSVLCLSSSSQAQCQAPAFVQTTFLSSVNKSCKKIDIVKYTLQVFLLGNLQIKSSSSISTEALCGTSGRPDVGAELEARQSHCLCPRSWPEACAELAL